MALEPSLNLGDLSADDAVLTEFRDGLQIILDEIFAKAHEEPNSNPIIVTRTAAQSGITGFVETKILFNLVQTGEPAEFDTSLGRFNPTVEGTYWISATIDLPNLTGTERIRLVIKKNNVEVWQGADSFTSATVTGMVEIASGEFIEVYVVHSSGSAQTTTSVQSRIKFAGYKIY